jgi:hypothetical protein
LPSFSAWRADPSSVTAGSQERQVARLVGGSGPIGLLTAAVLKGMGVTTIVSELTQARKEKATSSGVADHVLDPSQEDVPARVRELTGGAGADVAFECAGVNAVLDTMLDAVPHRKRAQRADPERGSDSSRRNIRAAHRRPAEKLPGHHALHHPRPLCHVRRNHHSVQDPRRGGGEARTFDGELELLRSRGVEVVVLEDQRCVDMMRGFLSAHPELWAEDMAE